MCRLEQQAGTVTGPPVGEPSPGPALTVVIATTGGSETVMRVLPCWASGAPKRPSRL